MSALPQKSRPRQAIPSCLKCADIVAKVENRSAPKIWRKLILGYLRGCVTFQRHWEGPWLILDETIWSPTSARAKCISGSKNFRPSPQKDFCNNIGTNRTNRAGLTMSVLEGKADFPVAHPDFSV
jgi:hypothetical protein